MTKPRYLTKSRFKLALECPAKLYYTGKKKYADTKHTDEFLKALAEGGFQIGDLAKKYYPNGVEVFELDHSTALHKTKLLLQKDDVIIFEAAFEYAGCFIRVDILEKKGNRFNLIEVKAKSFKSNDEFYKKRGGISSSWKPYLWDVAFQTWLMRNVFPEAEIYPYLMLADKNKTATVSELNQKFRIIKNDRGRIEVVANTNITDADLGDKILTAVNVEDAVDLILSNEDKPGKNPRPDELYSFEKRIDLLAPFYQRDERYHVDIGKQCKNCEFKNINEPKKLSGFEECWSNELKDFYNPMEPHIFEVWNYRKSPELIKNGMYTLTDLYADAYHFENLNDRQKLQVQRSADRDKSEWYSDQLASIISEWKYPLHFIDFETSMVAVPFYKGFRPYEQIAFQFSSHTVNQNGKIEHSEWICAEPGIFPNFEFVKALKQELEKDDGTIFRYAPHENTVLRQIQKQMEDHKDDEFGELIEWIDTITQWKDDSKTLHCGERNMVDLLAVLKKNYYHPFMKGSNSIKAVLPAIFQTSDIIRQRYSKPLKFGTNLKGMRLWQKDSDTSIVSDPYKLLPDRFQDIDLKTDEMFLEDGQISEGGAAAVAFAKMQFTEMSDMERNALKEALLQYCELDTLAMVMIWEHWMSNNNALVSNSNED
jgi:hypothetical protein